LGLYTLFTFSRRTGEVNTEEQFLPGEEWISREGSGRVSAKECGAVASCCRNDTTLQCPTHNQSRDVLQRNVLPISHFPQHLLWSPTSLMQPPP